MSFVAVSVVIPVGRVDTTLERQLHAVAVQELNEPFEVILSLNTPEAGAAEALNTIVENLIDDRFRVVDSTALRGAAHARNAGIGAASGQRVAFCDADDLVHVGWLAELMRELEKYDAVSGRVIDVFPEERMAGWRPPATSGSLPNFMGVPYVLTGNLAVKRDAFEAAGGFDESLTRCEDIALGWSLLRAGYTIGYAQHAVIDYHHRAGRWSMLRQHYFYGLGMSEVLARYGLPYGNEWAPARGLRALRPNGQQVERHTVMGTLRRCAVGTGRVIGHLRRKAVP